MGYVACSRPSSRRRARTDDEHEHARTDDEHEHARVHTTFTRLPNTTPTRARPRPRRRRRSRATATAPIARNTAVANRENVTRVPGIASTTRVDSARKSSHRLSPRFPTSSPTRRRTSRSVDLGTVRESSRASTTFSFSFSFSPPSPPPAASSPSAAPYIANALSTSPSASSNAKHARTPPRNSKKSTSSASSSSPPPQRSQHRDRDLPREIRAQHLHHRLRVSRADAAALLLQHPERDDRVVYERRPVMRAQREELVRARHRPGAAEGRSIRSDVGVELKGVRWS